MRVQKRVYYGKVTPTETSRFNFNVKGGDWVLKIEKRDEHEQESSIVVHGMMYKT